MKNQLNKANDYLVPTVIETTNRGERSYDIYSRLLNDRIIFMGEDVNSHTTKILRKTSSSTLTLLVAQFMTALPLLIL